MEIKNGNIKERLVVVQRKAPRLAGKIYGETHS